MCVHTHGAKKYITFHSNSPPVLDRQIPGQVVAAWSSAHVTEYKDPGSSLQHPPTGGLTNNATGISLSLSPPSF